MNFLCNKLKFLICRVNNMYNPDKKQQKLLLFSDNSTKIALDIVIYLVYTDKEIREGGAFFVRLYKRFAYQPHERL